MPIGNDYYDDAEVAAILGISVSRLRNKISAGESLPPRFQPAGVRKRLWPRQDFDAWLRRFEHSEVRSAKKGYLG